MDLPGGDGTVNVGVGLLSTFSGWKDVNTSHLMEAFCDTAPARWGLSADTLCGAPTGGKLPTGFSVKPSVGPNWLTAGDALGSVNPFNGEGISLAYETGRIAADVIDQALRTGDGLALQRYPERLDEMYGLYFKVARLFVRAIGNPKVMRELTRIGFQSKTLMEVVLRIMANLDAARRTPAARKSSTRWSPPSRASPRTLSSILLRHQSTYAVVW
jgi:flavin-dependent dehydrogenase